MNTRKEQLINKGVQMPIPDGVVIGEEVNVENISGQGVIIYPGCKIYGASTVILANARIGYEGPVTVENCQIGPHVVLKGGFFKEAVFLEKASMGAGAHVREGTILEEEASGAHTVGLKQTILFPYVTLGSLINFCDCLMTGGTSRKNHSEVGSSYIHFNYTPDQDKATPSLLGNVPEGVMLDQNPIFLGGQGGLVGPAELTFGTVIAAGTICRKDETRPNRLIFGGGMKAGSIERGGGGNRDLKRVLKNNFKYIANLIALEQWYIHIRRAFLSEAFPESMWQGLCSAADRAIEERLKRLKGFIEIQKNLLDANTHKAALYQRTSPLEVLGKAWEKIIEGIENHRTACPNPSIKEAFQYQLELAIHEYGKVYLPVIKHLDPAVKNKGAQWLQGIVDGMMTTLLAQMPLQE